jgi:hypothetical protein
MTELGNLNVEVCTVKNNRARSVKRARFVKNNGPDLKIKD